MNPMVVNLHLLDACDYRCAHCFAHFGANKTLRCEQWKTIVDNILNGMAVERFNLADGEPLLYTVVSKLNYTEDLGSFIRAASPERWKIFKMKTFQSNLFDNSHLVISDAQFDSFVRRHQEIPVRRVIERTMAGTYIMADAMGNLVDTESYDNTPVANLLTEDFSSAFRRLHFDYGTYNMRYVA
jgi:hypothetical protein